MKHKTENWIFKFRIEEEKSAGLVPYFFNHVNAYKIPINKIREYTPHSGKILETGFGTCFVSIWLSYFGYNVEAIDIDKEVVSYGMRNNNKLEGKVGISQKDILDISGEEKWNTIFHIGVLEHFNDQMIKKILKKQINLADYVIFCVPNIHAKDANDLYGDERLMPAEKWEKLIKASGAEIIDKFGFIFKKTPFQICDFVPSQDAPFKAFDIISGLNKLFYSMAYNYGYVIRKGIK